MIPAYTLWASLSSRPKKELKIDKWISRSKASWACCPRASSSSFSWRFKRIIKSILGILQVLQNRDVNLNKSQHETIQIKAHRKLHVITDH